MQALVDKGKQNSARLMFSVPTPVSRRWVMSLLPMTIGSATGIFMMGHVLLAGRCAQND